MKIGDVEVKRVQRQKRKVLLVPEVVHKTCEGCTFLAGYKRGSACLVRWKTEAGCEDRHPDCSGDDNDDGIGRIYIEPDKLPEYLAALAAARLEGKD